MDFNSYYVKMKEMKYSFLTCNVFLEFCIMAHSNMQICESSNEKTDRKSNKLQESIKHILQNEYNTHAQL